MAVLREVLHEVPGIEKYLEITSPRACYAQALCWGLTIY